MLTTSGCTSGIISGSTSGYYFKVKRVYLCIPFAKQAVRRGPFIWNLALNILIRRESVAEIYETVKCKTVWYFLRQAAA